MLLNAAEDFNIDLSQSYMVGDSENDIKAGMTAGCKSILVNGVGSDYHDGDYRQIDTVESVLEFVDRCIY